MNPSSGAAWGTTAVAVSLLVTPLVVGAFKDGPLPGLTGGFGERTCHACHFDHAINDPAGSLRVSGIPESYTPGVQYAIRIGLRRPGTRSAGFQIAVRFAEGPRAGQDAGALESLDDRVQIVQSPDGRLHYVQHTRAGSRPDGAGEADWSVRWRAPTDMPSPVAIHVAANAGNDDDSPLGDYVYVVEAGSRPE